MTPSLEIRLALSSDTCSISAPGPEPPYLVIATTLLGPPVLTVFRGQDAGTVLGTSPNGGIWAQIFSFTDPRTGHEAQPREHFTKSCVFGPRPRSHFVELHRGVAHTERFPSNPGFAIPTALQEMKPGHEYQIQLKPKSVRAWPRSVEDLFDGKSDVDPDELPGFLEVCTQSNDRPILKIRE